MPQKTLTCVCFNRCHSVWKSQKNTQRRQGKKQVFRTVPNMKQLGRRARRRVLRGVFWRGCITCGYWWSWQLRRTGQRREVHLAYFTLWTDHLKSRMNSCPRTNITELAQACRRRERRKEQRNLNVPGPDTKYLYGFPQRSRFIWGTFLTWGVSGDSHNIL